MMRNKASMTLFVAFGALACGRTGPAVSSAGAKASPPALPADVQAVAAVAKPPVPEPNASAAPVDRLVVATGEFLAPVHSHLAVRWPGRVGKIHVDEGARVKKDQPLLELETEYLALDVRRAEADATRAHAAADDAEREYERKKGLLAKASVAPATYEKAETGFLQAKATSAGADATLDLSRQHLADAVLRSPIDGVVSERHADLGERLADNSVAFVILQTSPLKLRFHTPERYLSLIHNGQAVRAVTDAYPGETFEGRVTVVGQSIDPATRTLAVDTEFPNGNGRLRPGLFARVELDLGAQGAPKP